MIRKGLLVMVLAISASVAQANIQITEWMYKGTDGEFIELTNVSLSPVDMTGWTFQDDKYPIADPYDLSGFGTVQPGESVVLTEQIEVVFRAAWSLDPAVKVVGLLGDSVGENIGRNDAIFILDDLNQIADSLDYGDGDFPGTPRTDSQSVNIPATDYGFTEAQTSWELATVGDFFGSYASTGGDIGSPGFVVPEPATIALVLMGGMAMLRRRR